MTHFGTSAKYIDAQKKIALVPRKDFDLSPLRVMFSTGSPLRPESFDYVYQCVKDDLCLSSISGGTDIVSCFALGIADAAGVARRAAVPRPRHGRRRLRRSRDARSPARKGELVCKAPFPAMPVGFWNDPGRRASTAPPTSSAFPASGATATTSS